MTTRPGISRRTVSPDPPHRSSARMGSMGTARSCAALAYVTTIRRQDDILYHGRHRRIRYRTDILSAQEYLRLSLLP